LITAHLTGVLVVANGPLNRTVSNLVQLAALMAALSCFLAAYRSFGKLEYTLDMLEKAEQKFRLLFASNPEPMLVYDRRTLRFLEVNNAAIEKYGYTRAEFLALKVTDIRPPEDVPVFLNTVQLHRAKTSGPHFGQWRHRHKDGRVLNVEVTAQALEFAGRRAVLVVVKDVSERMQLGEQLRQAQKMEAVGRLAGGVAHDFNNVLTVITGYASILMESLEPDSPQALDLRQISRSADRAAALTRQLLAFSRRQVLQPRVLNLNSLVLNAEKMLERLIGEDIEIHLSLEASLGSVSADPGQLEQVIMNLAVNARDAMPDGGDLTFETRNLEVETPRSLGHFRVAPGSYIMLAVSDTGCGMDQETVGRIFEPFFTTKEKGKGTGLGLSTVYGIVKQSGGYVWVESAPGEGSTFTIYLPRVEAPADDEGDEPLSAARRGGETILLVEDDAVVRELARRILAGSGYHVLPAGDVVEAERFCRQHAGNLDLLLTDVVMPGMSGRDLARKLAVMRPRMRVLYMSGYTDNVIVHRGVLDPGTHFLQKPFTPRALLDKVREVLDGRLEPEPEPPEPCLA
jgi:PAS domain S-box-containing protein